MNRNPQASGHGSSDQRRKTGRRRLFSSPQSSLGPTGLLNVVRVGPRHSPWRDLYHLLLTLSWWQFLGLLACLYVSTNLLFAIAYLLEPNAIANAQPGSLADTFFFSVQTMATIGSGAMFPQTGSPMPCGKFYGTCDSSIFCLPRLTANASLITTTSIRLCH